MENEKIRKMSVDDLDDAFTLFNFAFQWEIPECEKEYIRTVPDEFWGYYDEGRLAAQIRVEPLKQYVHGKPFTMGAVSGVATWTEFRRHGYIRELIVHSFKMMQEKGILLSLLQPFSYEFYRRLGWETCFDYKKFTIQRLQLTQLGEFKGRWIRVGKDISLLKPVYDEYAKRFTGMLQRDDYYWDLMVFPRKGEAVVHLDENDNPRGYIIYRARDRKLNVNEMVYLDENSRNALWKFICNHDPMFDSIIVRIPIDDNLAFLLPNPHFTQEIVPQAMERIVDVQAFLQSFPFIEEKPVKMLLHVKDPAAPWNDGIFKVDINDKGQARVVKTAADKAGPDGQNLDDSQSDGYLRLECDIQTLTVLLLGYKSADFLNEAGRLKGSSEAVKAVNSAIPRKTTYLVDFN